MSYNIHWDSIFPADDPQNSDLRTFDRVDSFRRILRAVQPDVVCLQEINYLRSPRLVARTLQLAAGSSEASPWHAVKVNDSIIASPFDLLEKGYELETGSTLTVLDQAAAMIELPDGPPDHHELYVVCSHFRSGSTPEDESWRQRQADAIMAHVRDAITPGGHLDLPTGTPFVILGDFNAYATDGAPHVRTLLEGDIQDEARYGPDFRPDWDGTALTDALPSHNGREQAFYTWRNDREPFPPGELDRILFSDSSLQVRNAFVLDTTSLKEAALVRSGLLREDVLLDPATGNYDHLPLVVDFELGGP